MEIENNNKAKNIFIIINVLNHGGVQKAVSDLANLFVKMDYNVEILCGFYRGEPAYYLNDEVKVSYFSQQKVPRRVSLRMLLKNLNFFKIIKEFYKIINIKRLTKTMEKAMIDPIEKIENSIIISTANNYTKLINEHSKDNNKLIAQIHGVPHPRDKTMNDAKLKYAKIDYLLLLTDETKKEFEFELLGYNQEINCVTVPNLVNCQKYDKNIKRKKQIISVGRLTSEKGMDRLLLIWKDFLINNKDYVLKIVGEGPQKEELIKLALSLNISESVIFSGNLTNDETVKEMRKSKIYAMASTAESFGLVLVEAMSQGTPVVAYDVRLGPRAIIREGYNGFLISDNNIKTFVEKLEFILKDKIIYNNLSKNAIRTSKLYNEDSLRKIWREIFDN